METAASTDMRVGLPLVFGVLAVIAAVGMAAFGIAGDQLASGLSFAAAMTAATLAVVAYHVYG